MSSALSAAPLRFGPDGRFELQPQAHRLLIDGMPAPLGSRALDLLFALAAEPGRLIGKQELMDRVWPGVVVEENNLATQVSTLRKLLGGEVISTVPGRGYRFSAPLADAGRADRAGMAPPAPPRLQTRLPRVLTPIRGREDELAALGALIDRHAIVSVVGPGGIGKTLLTQHLLDARRSAYPQGVCWVELAGTHDAAALPRAIAGALGVRISEEDPLGSLQAAVAPLDMLMALDNAEHLLDALASLVQALLEAAPRLRVVVTSQAPLRLPGEVVDRIGPLAVPPGPLPAHEALRHAAVALFVERAQAADPRFALTDANAPAVIALCRELDGLALAIELAAARAPMLGVQQLADAMRDRLRLLTANRNRTAPARQQTLRAALEWSHGLLEPRERTVFRRLAVFAGSSSLDLIRRALSDEGMSSWDVLDGLGDLVDRSLVSLDIGDGDEEAAPRYRLLESTRAFALEQLAAAGEEQAMRRRHAEAMADHFTAQWDAHFRAGVSERAWARRILLDVDNARAAFAWARASGHAPAALAIGATIIYSTPCAMMVERNAVADACEQLVEATVDARLRLHALVAVCSARTVTRTRQVGDAAQRAVALARDLVAAGADRFELYLALARLALLAWKTGDVAVAQASVAEMQAIEDPAWPPQRLTVGLAARAYPSAQCDLTKRREYLALATRRVELGAACDAEPAGLLSNLMDAQLSCGDAEAAVRTGRGVLAQLAGRRDSNDLPNVHGNLGAALLMLGRAEDARPHLRSAWAMAPVMEIQPDVADHLALLAALEGRPEAAARLVGYADAGYRRRGQARQTNEASARDRADALARGALGDGGVEPLRAEGARLNDADIEALAFGHAAAGA